LTEKAINRKDGTLFRELLNKGNYKYKPSDFTKEQIGVQVAQKKKKVVINPWSTKTFESELDKAFPVK
jgi:hypothetical protein